MKITFLDKRKMSFVEVGNVVQIQLLPHWRIHEWMCITSDNERLGYNCTRFELQRIDERKDKA